MTAELLPFDYGDTPIRFLSIDGEPWAVLADLCRALGLTSPTRVAERIDPDSVNTLSLAQGIRGNPNVTVVNESGMYEVVIRSDKPEAVTFRRWITREVLPAIRKTGSYGKAPELRGDELLARAVVHANAVLAKQEQAIAELTPKAHAFDSFLDATGKYSIGAVAKMLGTSQNKLFRDLRNCGVLIAKGSMRNTPYQQFMHHFEVKAHEFERSNGEAGCSYTTYVQPSGVEFIRRKLNRQMPPLALFGEEAAS